MINLKTTEKTGKVVAIKSVVPHDQLMVITRNGVINRQRIDEIRVIGRATQGVRLVNLDEGDVVMDVARVIPENGNDDSGDGDDASVAEDSGVVESSTDVEGTVEVEGAAVAESGEGAEAAQETTGAEGEADSEGE